MPEIDVQVSQLRETLRNGRINQASKDTIGYSQVPNRQARSSVQGVRRDNPETSRDGTTTPGNKRSSKEESQRVRPGSGRSGNYDSSTTNGSKQGTGDTGILAAIERLDDIPTRIDNELPEHPSAPVQRYKEEYTRTMRGGKFVYCLIADRSQVLAPDEYKALPSRKDLPPAALPGAALPGAGKISSSVKKIGDTLFPAGKSTLTVTEVREYQEPLAAALIDYGGYLDKFLQMRSNDPTLPEIWGDMTELEAAVIARLMIRRGQKSSAAAEMVRTMVHGDDYIQAGIIVVPRIIRTAETLQAARKVKGRK